MNKPHIANYYAYVDDPQADRCELAYWLGITWESSGIVRVGKPGILVNPERGAHHIWSVGCRPHYRSNLIRISPIAHRLVHNGTHGEPISIRICCLAAKLAKCEFLCDPAEFDLEEIREASGKHVAGWLENQDCKENWLRYVRDEALGRIGDFETRSVA